MRLGGKVAVATGASSGIGHAIATLFAEQGATVYATDIATVREESARELFSAGTMRQATMSGEMSSRAWSVSRADFRFWLNNAGIVGTYEGIETVLRSTTTTASSR